MAEKGKKEKHEEQVQFAAYKQFCDDTTVEKQRAIKEATAKMEQLVAAIQKAEADAATLAKEIAQLDEDISVYEGDKKAATEVPDGVRWPGCFCQWCGGGTRYFALRRLTLLNCVICEN